MLAFMLRYSIVRNLLLVNYFYTLIYEIYAPSISILSATNAINSPLVGFSLLE